MVEDLIKRLKEAAQAATPQNLDTAQQVERFEDGSHITCPTCGGEGYAELNSDFCNYDGKAIGVQFYGIGPEHSAAEAYFRAASPAAILELIAMIEQQVARLTALESERDALLAAAGKEAVASIFVHATKRCELGVGCDETGVCYAEVHGEPDRCSRALKPIYQVRRHEDEEKVWCDAYEATHYACSKRPEFYETRIVYTASPVQAGLTDERISEIIDEFDGCSWIDGELRIDCKEVMRLARTLLAAAPAAALENGDGRDVERWRWFVANYGALTLHEKFSDNIPRVFTHELKGRSWDEITQAIDAALSQKAGEQQ
jgi:hypothetical protein